MYDALTPGAQRAFQRAEARAYARGAAAVEPLDLLAALVDEAENRAAELLASFGLPQDRILHALGHATGLEPGSESDRGGDPFHQTDEAHAPLPHSPEFRSV